MDTAEQRVGRAILQQPRSVKIGERTYNVAPPTTATLILASEAISLLPQTKLDEGRIVEETLRIAKDCRGIGDVVAILILGAKGLTEEVSREKSSLFGLRRKKTTEVRDHKEELSAYLLESLSPAELNLLLFDLVKDFQIVVFFGNTSFLIGINILNPTKREVESETTASGQ